MNAHALRALADAADALARLGRAREAGSVGEPVRTARRPFGLYRRDDHDAWYFRLRGVRLSTGETDYDKALAHAKQRHALPWQPPSLSVAVRYRR